MGSYQIVPSWEYVCLFDGSLIESFFFEVPLACDLILWKFTLLAREQQETWEQQSARQLLSCLGHCSHGFTHKLANKTHLVQSITLNVNCFQISLSSSKADMWIWWFFLNLTHCYCETQAAPCSKQFKCTGTVVGKDFGKTFYGNLYVNFLFSFVFWSYRHRYLPPFCFSLSLHQI